MTVKFDPNMDGETADQLVCMEITNPLMFEDNMVGICSRCTRQIQYRPTAPKAPKKVCMTCATLAMMEEMDAGNEIKFGATAGAVSEARDYLRRKRN